MIIVTGAAGFIGSNMIKKLNKENFNDIIAVDDFGGTRPKQDISGLRWREKIEREKFLPWLVSHAEEIEFIFHLGARTDTAEFDIELLNRLNLEYTKEIWGICAAKQIPLIYASSAATYGDGSYGYDDEENIENLQPLNPYGESKQAFDKWALNQDHQPYFWAGFKFFNVYGPGEDHKGRMASVIYHAWNQIQKTGEMKLFRSHKENVKDGEQMRDFVYVGDVVDTLYWMMHHRNPQNNGIYNLGSGKAESFLDLANGVFEYLKMTPQISFIDIPEDIRDKYQYFTEAKMSKIRKAGYDGDFASLKEGIRKYLNEIKKPA